MHRTHNALKIILLQVVQPIGYPMMIQFIDEFIYLKKNERL